MHPKLIYWNYFNQFTETISLISASCPTISLLVRIISIPSQTIKKTPNGFLLRIWFYFVCLLFEFQLCESWSTERVTRQALDVRAQLWLCAPMNVCIVVFVILFLLLLFKIYKLIWIALLVNEHFLRYTADMEYNNAAVKWYMRY